MARRPKSVEAEEAEETGTALVNWEDQMAKDAELAAGMEANAGGGQWFSTRGGILQFNDMPVPGNQIGVVIVDHILENVFYEGKYDPNNISPPTCFALGRDDKTLAPHETVFDHDQAVSDACAGCENNAWGSADTGKGKACRNIRRLALIPAGDFDKAGRFEPYDDPDEFKKGAMGFLKIPPTSVRGYATFVKQIAGALKLPPYGVFTKLYIVPDARHQFHVVCEAIGPVPKALIPAIVARRAEAQATIEQPYNLDREEAAPAAVPARGRAPAAPAGRVKASTAAPAARGRGSKF